MLACSDTAENKSLVKLARSPRTDPPGPAGLGGHGATHRLHLRRALGLPTLPEAPQGHPRSVQGGARRGLERNGEHSQLRWPLRRRGDSRLFRDHRMGPRAPRSEIKKPRNAGAVVDFRRVPSFLLKTNS